MTLTLLRLPTGPLSATWAKFLLSLVRDLEPLGYSAQSTGNRISITTSVPVSADHKETFWDIAHQHRHRAVLSENADRIREFEAQHADVFVQMEVFQPSAIKPTIETVDFTSDRDRSIIDYVGCYQSVRSRRRVGRQMGLLVWDDGQTGHRPLIGAAVLASARYSQRLRDQYLGWPTHYPRTSERFDAQAKAIREAGLARIMQLSVACAMRPYTVLSGAWLMAVTPFTEVGQEAFVRACKHEPDPDLAAVVTTTGKGPSGSPFRGHRVVQLSNSQIDAAPGSRGNLFTHVHPTSEFYALYASFEDLVSQETITQACALLAAEQPQRFGSLKNVERAAMSYGLQRLSVNRRLFRGNEMGVHVGMLGTQTLQHLRLGTPRPVGDRPRLDWQDVIAVWTNRFLPPADGARETAVPETRAEHNAARRKRNKASHAFSQNEIPLSYDLQ